MSGPSNQSLVNAAKLISNNFTDRERRFAGNLVADLDERISERRAIARGGSASSGISAKVQLGINGAKHYVSGAVGAAVGIPVGIVATPIGGILASGAATVGTEVVISVVSKLLKAIPKRKVTQNAKIYNEFFPKENSDIIKLFAQLVSLSMVENLQTVLVSQENSAVLRSVKKTKDKALAKVAKIRKISRQDEKEAIKALADEEFQTIWDIFKEFARDKETYRSFKEMPGSKKIVALLANHCDLGDPADRSEIVSDWDINLLWINVLACYLEGKDDAVRESVLSSLASKFNVIPELPASKIPSSASFSSECSSSSGLGSSDSLASQAGIGYSPQFFAPKAAALLANQPEPEQSLSLSTRF